jgi:hypothetical protein
MSIMWASLIYGSVFVVGCIVTTLVVILIIANIATKVRHATFDPQGKVIVITGASSGIGEELAIQYAHSGAKVSKHCHYVSTLDVP